MLNVPPAQLSAKISEIANIQFHLNLYLSNTLSSFRSYVDQIPTQLKYRFGYNSEELEKFESILSALYDNKFNYRFSYKFRNYIQHCGFPEYHINYNFDESLNPEVDKGSYKMELNAKTLLTNYNSWGPVKKDLEQVKGFLDVNEVMLELGTSITNLDMLVSTFYSEDLNSTVEYLNSTFGVLDFMNHEYCILDSPRSNPIESLNNLSVENLSTEVLSKELRKNEVHANR